MNYDAADVQWTSSTITNAMGAIGYFTTGYGDSGWRELPVSPQYSTISFEWDAPVYDGQEFNEAVGIWPDPQGENREILIRRIRVFLLPDNS